MALLKVGNSLLKSNNALLNTTDIGKFLYLTYFNNFSITTDVSTDVPVIGPTTRWNRSGDRRATFSSTTPMTDYYSGSPDHAIDANYGGLPCLSLYEPYTDWSSDGYDSPDTFFDRTEYPNFSVEVIMNHLENHCYWQGFYISGAFDAYRNQWSSPRGIAFEHPSGLIDTLGTGFYTYGVGGYGVCISRQDNLRYKMGVTHYAQVVDLEKNTIRGYLDGVLAFTGRPDRNGNWHVGFYVAYSRCQFTQFAIRKGDCSIDGGMSYPVPTTPYRRF